MLSTLLNPRASQSNHRSTYHSDVISSLTPISNRIIIIKKKSMSPQPKTISPRILQLKTIRLPQPLIRRHRRRRQIRRTRAISIGKPRRISIRTVSLAECAEIHDFVGVEISRAADGVHARGDVVLAVHDGVPVGFADVSGAGVVAGCGVVGPALEV